MSKVFNLIEDELYDILTSGYSGELSDWHKKELTNLFERFNEEEKKEILKEYCKTLFDSDSDGVELAEIIFIANLCGAKNVRIEFD